MTNTSRQRLLLLACALTVAAACRAEKESKTDADPRRLRARAAGLPRAARRPVPRPSELADRRRPRGAARHADALQMPVLERLGLVTSTVVPVRSGRRRDPGAGEALRAHRGRASATTADRDRRERGRRAAARSAPTSASRSSRSRQVVRWEIQPARAPATTGDWSRYTYDVARRAVDRAIRASSASSRRVARVLRARARPSSSRASRSRRRAGSPNELRARRRHRGAQAARRERRRPLPARARPWLAQGLDGGSAPTALVDTMIDQRMEPAVARAIVDAFVAARRGGAAAPRDTVVDENDARRAYEAPLLAAGRRARDVRRVGARGGARRQPDARLAAELSCRPECAELIERARPRLAPRRSSTRRPGATSWPAPQQPGDVLPPRRERTHRAPRPALLRGDEPPRRERRGPAGAALPDRGGPPRRTSTSCSPRTRPTRRRSRAAASASARSSRTSTTSKTAARRCSRRRLERSPQRRQRGLLRVLQPPRPGRSAVAARRPARPARREVGRDEVDAPAAVRPARLRGPRRHSGDEVQAIAVHGPTSVRLERFDDVLVDSGALVLAAAGDDEAPVDHGGRGASAARWHRRQGLPCRAQADQSLGRRGIERRRPSAGDDGAGTEDNPPATCTLRPINGGPAMTASLVTISTIGSP